MIRWIKYTLCSAALVAAGFCAVLEPVEAKPKAKPGYEPAPIYCQNGNAKSELCPVIPTNINPDPAVTQKAADGYNSIFSPQNSAATDVQSPLDNTSWQTFVALNWAAGKPAKPAKAGVSGQGARVWQTWPRVSALFHDAPSLAQCTVPPDMAVFQIGANTDGQPDGHNEEYIQAATDFPLIDVDGNWTIYERRLNGIEATYLKAPDGSAAHTLTTLQGQAAFVAASPSHDKNLINFPAYTGALAGTNAANGAIEIKAAWRILNLKKHPQDAKRFFIVRAMLTVAPQLVQGGSGKPICAQVDLGLVGMHIMQKNLAAGALFPSWIWSSFEHVDNAPMAEHPCDVTKAANCNYITPNVNDPCPPARKLPPVHYSYYNKDCPYCVTNRAPVAPSGANAVYTWSPQQPYAGPYMSPGGPKQSKVGTQVSRCFATYGYTAHLNKLWRAKLAAAGSVFQNYMLVGTQWAPGADEPIAMTPLDATLPYLSNTVLETYMQAQFNLQQPFSTGSCISCHALATLPNQAPQVCNVASNFSFLPGEAIAGLTRTRLGVKAAGDKCPAPPAAKSP